MTPQEIQERNKQIALMLNIKIEQCYPENKDYKQHGIVYTLEKEFADNVNSIFLSVSKLKFHSDWNWLMEAVEFIYGTLGFRKYSYSNEEHSRCLFTDMAIISQNHNYGGGNIITDSGKQSTEKEAVFIAVSDFAKLYNEKKI
jgi:hypothetical protein